MKPKNRLSFSYLASFLFIFFVFSQLVTPAFAAAKNNEEKIKANLEALLPPNLSIDDISASPVDGLYQITAGPLVLYATKDGKYALTGDIVSLKDAQTNLTEQARKKARVSALDRFGEENMIVYTPKETKATVTVFTDIDCGYCRKFHAQMEQMLSLGLKIRYLPFPRSGVDSPSFEKAEAVWCSEKTGDAMTKAKQGQTINPVAKCDKKAVIEEAFNFGLLTGVMGTPTFILGDGTLVPGYLPPDKLAELAIKVQP